MKVRVTFTARRDLDEIFHYFNERSPRAADALLSDIEAAVEILAVYPEGSPLTSAPGIRVKVVRRHRYLIFYQIRPDAVEILRIRHGARLTQFADG